MLVKAARFAAIMLAALTTALAFCHLMEMPARLSWDAQLWVGSTVHGGVFRLFGTVGAALEVGTVVVTAALAFMVRDRRPAVFRLSLAGANSTRQPSIGTAIVTHAALGW